LLERLRAGHVPERPGSRHAPLHRNARALPLHRAAAGPRAGDIPADRHRGGRLREHGFALDPDHGRRADGAAACAACAAAARLAAPAAEAAFAASPRYPGAYPRLIVPRPQPPVVRRTEVKQPAPRRPEAKRQRSPYAVIAASVPESDGYAAARAEAKR